MSKKDEILSTIRHLKPKYQKEGVILLGLFGSYAKDKASKYSDIDIAYRLDYGKFSKYYKDGFSKLIRLEEIKKELEKEFKTKVDFVPNSNQDIQKDLISV
ncbi:MAG: nucleotidyltransferase domain-containing protein [Epsilonproteobacteria bacterium]|nr:nucleotidyltransferase domain-containing protein [Campylobacterota bacterium]